MAIRIENRPGGLLPPITRPLPLKPRPDLLFVSCEQCPRCNACVKGVEALYLQQKKNIEDLLDELDSQINSKIIECLINTLTYFYDLYRDIVDLFWITLQASPAGTAFETWLDYPIREAGTDFWNWLYNQYYPIPSNCIANTPFDLPSIPAAPMTTEEFLKLLKCIIPEPPMNQPNSMDEWQNFLLKYTWNRTLPVGRQINLLQLPGILAALLFWAGLEALPITVIFQGCVNNNRTQYEEQRKFLEDRLTDARRRVDEELRKCQNAAYLECGIYPSSQS